MLEVGCQRAHHRPCHSKLGVTLTAVSWLVLHSGIAAADTTGCHSYLGSWEPGLPRCNMTQQEYVQGSWVKVPTQCRARSLQELGEIAYPYSAYCNPQHHVCNEMTDTCSRKVLHLAQYQWQPHACNLHHFSPEELDRKLSGRTVAFAGDSIQLQQFYSWKNLMRPVIQNPSPSEWHTFRTEKGARHHVQAAQFLTGQPCCNHFHNQSLEVLPTAEWLQLARNADVIVLNTGHHWHRRDSDFQHYSTMVHNVMQTLKAETHGYIVFRTSTWGHHKCSTIKEPLGSVQEALNFGSYDNDPYHWMSPIYREHLWQDAAVQLGIAHRFRYVNASMTLLRGDGHLDKQQDAGTNHVFDDCLHYCMPGPPDWWNWVLLNTLMTLDFS